MKNEMSRKCSECKHGEEWLGVVWCTHPSSPGQSAECMRYFGKCGEEGKLWEPCEEG